MHNLSHKPSQLSSGGLSSSGSGISGSNVPKAMHLWFILKLWSASGIVTCDLVRDFFIANGQMMFHLESRSHPCRTSCLP